MSIVACHMSNTPTPVKPENIRVCPNGDRALTLLGLVRLISSDGPNAFITVVVNIGIMEMVNQHEKDILDQSLAANDNDDSSDGIAINSTVH